MANWTGKTLAAAAFVAASMGAASAGEVSITVNGVQPADGPLYVSLQTREQFMSDDGAHGRIIKDPAEGSVSVNIDGVADGEYAVSVWHDINGNGEFDRAPQGWPLDGWSMLNAAKLMGPPNFDAVKFDASGGAVLSLDMIYPAQ